MKKTIKYGKQTATIRIFEESAFFFCTKKMQEKFAEDILPGREKIGIKMDGELFQAWPVATNPENGWTNWEYSPAETMKISFEIRSDCLGYDSERANEVAAFFEAEIVAEAEKNGISADITYQIDGRGWIDPESWSLVQKDDDYFRKYEWEPETPPAWMPSQEALWSRWCRN